MNNEGLRAFEETHRVHMERSTYAELYRLISDKARAHNVRCRLDALHFLTLNFEFMVAEPLGQQRSGTLAAIMNGELRHDIERDLDMLFDSPGEFGADSLLSDSSENEYRSTPDPVDPSRHQQEEPRGVSSGRMLKHVAEHYHNMNISKWRLWG